MRCPACGADNPAEAKWCAGCGERFNRRQSRREILDETDSPFGKRNDTRNRAAMMAYRYSVFGLIPLLGLVLGPLAVLYGLIAWRQSRTDPTVWRSSHVTFALVFGVAEVVCNVLGITLMVLGLISPGP